MKGKQNKEENASSHSLPTHRADKVKKKKRKEKKNYGLVIVCHVFDMNHPDSTGDCGR